MGLEFTSFYEKFIIIGDVSVLKNYLYMKIKHAFFSQRNMMMTIFLFRPSYGNMRTFSNKWINDVCIFQ